MLGYQGEEVIREYPENKGRLGRKVGSKVDPGPSRFVLRGRGLKTSLDAGWRILSTGLQRGGFGERWKTWVVL